MKVILVSAVAIVGLTIGIAMRPTGAARSQLQGVQTRLGPDYAPSAFGQPVTGPRLTRSQAIDLVNRTYWNLSRASGVSAVYTGWTSTTSGYRSATGLHAYGRRDVWKVVAAITTGDPGGFGACPTASTAADCPGLRVYHHMIFIIDDKAARVLEAVAY